MIISIASGKGGTGKTTVAVSLALSLNDVQLLDCDVEEPNAALFLKPTMIDKKAAHILVPTVDESKCTYCGKCSEVCEYNAIAIVPPKEKVRGKAVLFPLLCHGCGACQYLCPENAITEIKREIGVIEFGRAGDVQFVHGKLNVGEAMAPPVIRQVKQYANPTRTVIVDAPPGTACAVITAVQGTDFCILVTEPTPFGLNDLKLAVEAMRKIDVLFGVVINRCDLGDDKTGKFCSDENIPVLMKIPFSQEIATSYSKGESIVELYPEYREKFCSLLDSIESLLRIKCEK